MGYLFRKFCSFVFLYAVVMFVASCTKAEFQEEDLYRVQGVARRITASASIPQIADNTHPDASLNVVWHLDDTININGTNVTINLIKNNGIVAYYYSSSLYANTVSGLDHYWAVFPYTLCGTYNGALPTDFASIKSLAVHLPDTQIVNATVNDALRGKAYMAAHVAVESGTDNVYFRLCNLGALLELTLQPKAGNASNRVDSIVFSSSNAALAGEFAVSDNLTDPTVTPTAGTNKVVVKFDNKGNRYIDITDGATLYVVLPPLESNNLNMKIYGAGGRYTEMNTASTTLLRSRYYSSTISDIAFDEQ